MSKTLRHLYGSLDRRSPPFWYHLSDLDEHQTKLFENVEIGNVIIIEYLRVNVIYYFLVIKNNLIIPRGDCFDVKPIRNPIMVKDIETNRLYLVGRQ